MKNVRRTLKVPLFLLLLITSCAGQCDVVGGELTGVLGNPEICGVLCTNTGTCPSPCLPWEVDGAAPECETAGTPTLWYAAALDEGYSDGDPVTLAESHGAVALDAEPDVETARPTYKASGGPGNAAWWSFPDATDRLITGSTTALEQPNMVVIVGMSSNMAQRQKFVDGIAAGNRHFVEINTDLDVYAGTVLDGPVISESQWHAIIVEFNGASSSLVVDGVEVATGSTGDGTVTLTGLSIGVAYTISDHRLIGGIAEVRVYDTPATRADVLDDLDCLYGEFPQ